MGSLCEFEVCSFLGVGLDYYDLFWSEDVLVRSYDGLRLFLGVLY